HTALAKRSFAVASAFGLASSLSVVVLGDESGYTLTENQKMKLAAIEAMWETEPAPAGFTLFGFPDQQAHETHAEVKIPYVMGLIATRSLDGEVEGISDILVEGAERIKRGVIARRALRELQVNSDDKVAQLAFETFEEDLGHAMLLDTVAVDPLNPTDTEVLTAADTLVPAIAPLFWSFRIMVALGMFFILATAYAFYLSSTHQVEQKTWFLRVLAFSWPLPWVACELGWFVAEFGRQPWIIEGVLPTANAVSGLSAWEVGMTLAGFTALYAVLIAIEVRLMLYVLNRGPEMTATDTAPAAPAITGMANLAGK
ncbi:MAG: cytochrome ubiquinol oxidase subunit I, partial [Litorivicinus sp.]